MLTPLFRSEPHPPHLAVLRRRRVEGGPQRERHALAPSHTVHAVHVARVCRAPYDVHRGTYDKCAPHVNEKWPSGPWKTFATYGAALPRKQVTPGSRVAHQFVGMRSTGKSFGIWVQSPACSPAV